MEKNIFEVATRTKMRFEYKGLISVEDLWDLSVVELDTIFKGLNSKMKQTSEESLLGTKTSADVIIGYKIEIVKHIVAVKLEDANRKALELESRNRKNKILEILESKQEESLANKSEEELKEMLKDLK